MEKLELPLLDKDKINVERFFLLFFLFPSCCDVNFLLMMNRNTCLGYWIFVHICNGCQD
jgi:hypothetical protein